MITNRQLTIACNYKYTDLAFIKTSVFVGCYILLYNISIDRFVILAHIESWKVPLNVYT